MKHPKIFVEPSNFFLFDNFTGFSPRIGKRFSNATGDTDSADPVSGGAGPGGFSGGLNEISLPSVNRAPVANIGNVAAITLPTSSVTLNGSLSSDPDGDTMSYYWSQLSGPTSAVITNSTKNIATATALAQGSYVFGLTVTDSKGATGNAQVTVTVYPTPAGAPMFTVTPQGLGGSTQTTVTTTTIGPAANTLPGNMPNGQPAVLGGGGGMMGGGGGGDAAPGADQGASSGGAAANAKLFGVDKKYALMGIGVLLLAGAYWKRKAIIEFVKHL